MNHWAAEAWMETQYGDVPEFSGAYPVTVIKRGYNEWKRTGVVPDPVAVAARDPRWERDLYALDAIVERAKPPERKADDRR